MKEIGEIDCCPYCKEKLSKIPSRKKKCPYCGKFIYVRTRPWDRERVLIKESQRDEMEKEWQNYFQAREMKQLLQDNRYQKERQQLSSKLGRDPTLSELKFSVINKQMKDYASKREWGLYRNCKLTIAQTFEQEGNLMDALRTIFEVCYLDINGANNVMVVDGKAMSYARSEKLGIKDFDPKTAFFAPAIITWIEKWTSSLNLSEKDAKNLFIKTNKENKPIKIMPVTPEEAWNRLTRKLGESRRVDAIDVTDQSNTIQEIEQLIRQNKRDEVNKLLIKIRSLYKKKKYNIENIEEVKSFVLKLMVSKNGNLSNHGEKLMIDLLKKDQSNFSDLAKFFVKRVQENFNEYSQSPTIGQLASVNIDITKNLIPILKEVIRSHGEWNTRRFSAFNLGAIGEKHPEIVKDTIPLMIDYIKSPFKITNPKSNKITVKGITIEISMSDNIDQTQWLKDAYIDTLGMYATGDKRLILPYRNLFEELAKKDPSEYTRKKAQRVLDILST